MAEKIYKAFNFAAPTSAMSVGQTSGTSIRTMLQLATPSTKGIWITGWGITHDGHASCTKAEAELIVFEDAATVTTGHSTSGVNDITQFSPNDEVTLIDCSGNTKSGYASAGGTENTGSIATSDLLDTVYLSPTTADRYVLQWPMGREPQVAASRYVRIRVQMTGNATNVKCWIEWGE